jgi:hypothetical protein
LTQISTEPKVLTPLPGLTRSASDDDLAREGGIAVFREFSPWRSSNDFSIVSLEVPEYATFHPDARNALTSADLCPWCLLFITAVFIKWPDFMYVNLQIFCPSQTIRERLQ